METYGSGNHYDAKYNQDIYDGVGDIDETFTEIINIFEAKEYF